MRKARQQQDPIAFAREHHYVYHPSLDEPDALERLGGENIDELDTARRAYMPDELTREIAQRMHYAAHRYHRAVRASTRSRWQQQHFRLRDRIVLGNRKLVYKAVHRQMSLSNCAEDMIGECDIVLIRAVTIYNPWLGIRFSTYAYTCLLRALARLARRVSSERVLLDLELDALPDDAATDPACVRDNSGFHGLDQFLGSAHPLLTEREKVILERRYWAPQHQQAPTLAEIGAALGISKERVRQVQSSALNKLRLVLGTSKEQ